ncbi:MAG: GAF domain-containing protein [Devosia sp.]|nr:GAF domain-containing protein [Devosia sp.]
MTQDQIAAAITTFERAIATMDQADAAWQALRGLSEALVGARLFTVMTVDWANERAGRVFTSHPEAYPVAGSKPIRYDGWFDIVHRQRQTYVANTIEAMRSHFPDHATIASLGCGSIVNLPVEIAGEMVATVNLLHEEHFYTPERVARTALLALPAQTAYLAGWYFDRTD